KHGDSLRASGGNIRLVPYGDKHFRQEIANDVFIIDDQDSNLLLLHGSAPCTASSFHLRSGWEVQHTGRSLPQVAFKGYVSMMARDNAVRHTHSQASSFRPFGREERIKNFLPDLVRHADTGVLDL